MESFEGTKHLPGDDKDRKLALEIDWLGKEVYVRFGETVEGIKDWPGLMVQTIGIEEAVFRTKGIPPLFTYWWHLARGSEDILWGLVIGTPDSNGIWRTCSVTLNKIKDRQN